MPPPPSTDAKILNYLTDREGAGITFSRILAPTNAPPPSPDATILNYLNDREGAPLSYAGLCPPPPPSPDATILNDLNDSERGWGHQYSVRSQIYKNIVTNFVRWWWEGAPKSKI